LPGAAGPPAIRGTRLTPADALRDHSRGVVSGGGRFQLGHALVALQVALSFVLVFGSTLFVRTLVSLTSQEMGFESSRVLVGNLDLRRTGVTPDARLALFTQVREALNAVPGVEAAANSFVTPVSGSTWNLGINVPGYNANDRRGVLFNGVSPGYFKAMGTALLAGRDIAATDRLNAPGVVVVNEAFWKGLKPADQKIIEDAVAAGIAWQNAELAKQEKELVETFRKAGMTVVPVDVEAFSKPVVSAVVPKFEAKWGKGTYEKLRDMK